ncbi:MAG: hypothetical protein WA853_04985 [Candidatus Acidiferrum sp.]
MRHIKRVAIGLTVLAVALIAAQFGLWAHFTSHSKSETATANRDAQHSPTEIPGVAGITLLVIAGVVAAYPRPDMNFQ